MGVLAKGPIEVVVDAIPHPGQGLLLASVAVRAARLLLAAELGNQSPKGGDTVALQGADLHHLGLPR